MFIGGHDVGLLVGVGFMSVENFRKHMPFIGGRVGRLGGGDDPVCVIGGARVLVPANRFSFVTRHARLWVGRTKSKSSTDFKRRRK